MKTKPAMPFQSKIEIQKNTLGQFDSIPRNSRYISEWNSNLVAINIAHELKESTTLYVIDLNKIFLSGEGGTGLIEEIVPLNQFPHLVDVLKIALNITCESYAASGLAQYIGKTVCASQRIFSWMLRNNRHTLNSLTPTDIKKLSESVGLNGWWNTLNYDQALRVAQQRFEENPCLADPLSVSHIRAINHLYLSQQIGLPIVPTQIPLWFREYVATFDCKQHVSYKFNIDHLVGKNSEHETMLTVLMRYCLLPAPFDSISFIPFSVIKPEVERVSKLRERVRLQNHVPAASREQTNINENETPQTATPNIPISMAQKLFAQAVIWLYEYSKTVLCILDMLRDHLENSITSNASKKTRKFDFSKVNIILARKGIPLQIDSISHERTNTIGHSLTTLVSTLFCACATLILVNHGRRPQEIIGYRVPYGLYFGCLSDVCQQISEKKIEIYVEKSPREYATFWCTKIVADAVDTLEQISQRFRPLFTDIKIAKSDLAERRADSLFRQRIMSVESFCLDPISFNWREHSVLFFKLSDVDYNYFANVQIPYRRLFMSLYMHRYDCPELYALKNHLRDMRMESLVAYFRDPRNRPTRDKIEVTLRRYQKADSLELDKLLRDASSEYLTEKISELLHGEPFGGAFPRIVRKILKRLSESTDFQEISPQSQIRIVAKKIEQHGYTPAPNESSLCMDGTNEITRHNSKCYEDGELHTERASPTLCSRCIHAFNPPAYMHIFLEDRDAALARSKDDCLSLPLRQLHQQHADTMTKIIELETRMVDENRRALSEFIDAWACTGENNG